MQYKLFQKDDAISQSPEAIAILTFQKDDAISNSIESSWEAEARSTCHCQLLEVRRHTRLPSCNFLPEFIDLEEADHTQRCNQHR